MLTKSLPAGIHLTCVLLLLLLFFSGCSRPPTVQFDHLPLIMSLRTACSARNPDWLAGVKKAVDERHAAAKMTAAEQAHFHKLIAQAQSGEWEDAERACLKFEQAQLSRRRSAPAAHTHDHSH